MQPVGADAEGPSSRSKVFLLISFLTVDSC